MTVRLDDDLKDRMDEHDDINWSEYIRQAIKDRLSQSDRRRIQKFVEEYEGDLPRLFSLYMFAERVSKHRIYETVEYLFDEELDDVVDEVDRDIDDLHISAMYKRSPDGERYDDLILETIEETAGEDIRAYIRDRISEAPTTVKEGVSLLPHFVRDRFDDDGTSIKKKSLERTWSIRSDTDIDPDTLLQTGLAFKDTYSSNAYHYRKYRIPGFALDVVEEFERHPSQFDIPSSHPNSSSFESLRDDAEFRAFLEWMGGASKSVTAHDEEEEIQEFLEESDLTSESFQSVRKDLVDENLLILTYRPHRSSTGGRSSRPSKWSYEFTDPANDYLTSELIE